VTPRHPAPAPAPADVTAQWAASQSRTKQTAALLAAALAAAAPGELLESASDTAARLGTTTSMIVQARRYLISLGLIRRHGHRYYAA
jgi:GTP-sensing pleiotropic transcriptional regulator CodY